MISVKLYETAISAGNVATDQASAVYDLSTCTSYSVITTFTGSPNSSLVVSASNDGTNFVAVDTQTINSTATKIYDKANPGYLYMKVTYAAGGTGSMNTKIVIKEEV